MTLSTSIDLLRNSDKHHLMLLYDDESMRSTAEVECINRALAASQFCVYATIDANDKDFAIELASKINDYERHIDEENFVLINFKPFYDSAANGQLTLFEQLKAEIETTLRKRIASGKSGKALLIADAACNMSRHKQFDECITLEGWWQDTYDAWMAKNLDITIICAHPSTVLKQQSHLTEQSRISHLHSLTLDLKDFIRPPAKAIDTRPLRILIVDPEPDIRAMYKQYLKSLPVEVVTVESGSMCLEEVATSGARSRYDLILIDTHTKDANGLEVAEKIIAQNPEQNIVITSTSEPNAIRLSLGARSLNVEKYPVLHKPFRFSELLGLIKPAKEAH